MANEDWELATSAPAIKGIDERGRIVVQGEVEFTCPECASEFEVQITLPLSGAVDSAPATDSVTRALEPGGEFDGQT